jgi:hypothetical protein
MSLPGPKLTSKSYRGMSAFGGKADIEHGKQSANRFARVALKQHLFSRLKLRQIKNPNAAIAADTKGAETLNDMLFCCGASQSFLTGHKKLDLGLG